MKHLGKWLTLTGDALLIPAAFVCKWLTDWLLYTLPPSECAWTRLGGQCITCGGTHFVNSILRGQIVEAFFHNEFLFLVTLVLVVSLICANLYWVFGLQFAKKVLQKIYNIPVLIISASLMILFLIVRNIPTMIAIVELVQKAAG